MLIVAKERKRTRPTPTSVPPPPPKKQKNPPPPPPPSHTLSLYIVSLLCEGGEGGQRESRGAIVQKYRSFVHGGNSSKAG
jgi:hypothetical protein